MFRSKLAGRSLTTKAYARGVNLPSRRTQPTRPLLSGASQIMIIYSLGGAFPLTPTLSRGRNDSVDFGEHRHTGRVPASALAGRRAPTQVSKWYALPTPNDLPLPWGEGRKGGAQRR